MLVFCLIAVTLLSMYYAYKFYRLNMIINYYTGDKPLTINDNFVIFTPDKITNYVQEILREAFNFGNMSSAYDNKYYPCTMRLTVHFEENENRQEWNMTNLEDEYVRLEIWTTDRPEDLVTAIFGEVESADIYIKLLTNGVNLGDVEVFQVKEGEWDWRLL